VGELSPRRRVMSSIGIVELVLVGVVSLIALAIPTATFVVAILIYSRLGRIERTLKRRE
jgi:hypothetical protein